MLQRRRYLPFCIFAAGLSVVGYARAEVYNCNGKYTNKPCDGSSAKVETGTSKPENLVDTEQTLKQSLYHDLNIRNIRARRDYGIKIDLHSVEQFCLKEKSSLSDCEVKINEVSDRLRAQIAEADQIRTQEKAIELQKQANKIQEERNKIEAEKVTEANQHPRVIIIDHSRSSNVIQHPHTGTVVITDSHQPRPELYPRKSKIITQPKSSLTPSASGR